MGRWYALTRKNLEQNDDGAGIYFIRTVHEDGKPRTLARLFKKDKDGLLYIGKTGSGKNAGLYWRIRCFWHEAIGQPQSPHGAGERYRELLKRHFPVKSLQYRYRRLPSTAFASKEENKLLKFYERRFGGLPPLNHQG